MPDSGSGNRDFSVQAPTLSLPKGGGAIRGIGEKFSANAATGTGSLSVPIALSKGRSDFTPQLSLGYDSGSGNGPFGIGWSLSNPSITRKTDKGLPRYRDAEESDSYILSGSEDLVQTLKQNSSGGWDHVESSRLGFKIRQYRPRIEGLFARIERWTDLTSNRIHWRSISRDNVLSVYGYDETSCIADPDDKNGRIFNWLICRSYDDKGNAIAYEYVAENDDNVDFESASEGNRSRTANRYLKRIKYGNRKPLLIDTSNGSFRKSHLEDVEFAAAEWMFEAVFDYGEGHYQDMPPDDRGRSFVQAAADKPPNGSWPARADSFSVYRAGFEVRTCRLCRRVLQFHHFPDELAGDSYLVRSTEFNYREKPIGSFIQSVLRSGYKRQPDQNYLKRSLPALELTYTLSPLEDPAYDGFQIQQPDETSLQNLPEGLSDPYQWVDLDGEGISGVLTDQGDAWFYKRNLGAARFGPLERLPTKPSLADLPGGGQQLLDLAGDGNLDLVALERPTPGFYERTGEKGWKNFRSFELLPNVAWDDPNLKFVDLTGDGHADILITEDECLIWHPSLAARGFGSAIRLSVAPDEARGPSVIFADGTQSIHLADVTGDGLTDLLRIRNGEICYWPNLGYGRFGARIIMDNAPWFDHADQFDQRRIRLADTDGSGTTDILYLSPAGVRIYLNEVGNAWSEARLLKQFPMPDNATAMTVVDLLGTGTACLVWSSKFPSYSAAPLRYIDLMQGNKPHLLVGARNNLGSETLIQYASSTEFYLADKAAGKPWVTRLPFPVHVVKRVETCDRISRNRFVTRYVFHHGHFDGVEREFRGFGMVEQFDTEEFATFTNTGDPPAGDNFDETSHVPTVVTKTWFHTGAYFGGERISKHFEHEYYREVEAGIGAPALTDSQIQAMLLDDSVLTDNTGLPDGAVPLTSLTPDEHEEACRALKGMILRQENYALDNKAESDRPYTVSERNYTILPLQPRASNRHAVFLTHGRETIDFNYERKLFAKPADPLDKRYADPRVTHSIVFEIDGFGNVLTSLSIGYGRRIPGADAVLTAADHARQGGVMCTLVEKTFTIVADEIDAWRTPLPAEAKTYELINLKFGTADPDITNLLRFDDLPDLLKQARDGNHDLLYEDLAADGANGSHDVFRRPIEWVRTLYRSNALIKLLDVGTLETLALPGEGYRLIFTPGLLTKIYQRPRPPQAPEPLLADIVATLTEGGYVDLDSDGHWWMPSGRQFYSSQSGDTPAQELTFAAAHFFLPHRYRDAFAQNTIVSYDSHDLLAAETSDPLGNTARVENDYRVLSPSLVIDPNGNRTAAAFDALGMVVGTAVQGKATESIGDLLSSFEPDLDDATILSHIEDPLTSPNAVLGTASTRLIYDLFAYQRSQSDPQILATTVYTLTRETHESDLAPGAQTIVRHAFSYSDGFEREIQKKVLAEPGPLVEGGPDIAPRWVGSGWTVFNNKGKPVRQFEPFFSASPAFEFANAVGVSPVLFYDPLGRVVATLHPNHTYEKVLYDPWRQESWDANDTVSTTINPDADNDVSGFFRRLPDQDYLPTWAKQRDGGQLGLDEQIAVTRTLVHAGTPGLTFFDTLGRPFLTVADNCFDRSGVRVNEQYSTRTELDIESNQRAVIDALGRTVATYDYDMIGNRIHQSSMEAGERWILNDVAGKPIRAWNQRIDHARHVYDALRRPTSLFVQPANSLAELLAEQIVYGESQPGPETNNLRGKIFQQFDSAGHVTHQAYDFKGNLLSATRSLLSNYRDQVDWSSSPAEDGEIFTSTTAFDALNRPIMITPPDASVIHVAYNEAGLLQHVDVNLRGATAATPFVTNIGYNAKGDRTLIAFGNGVRTQYEYDPQTFRLRRLFTARGAGFPDDGADPASPPSGAQNLSYVYDPVGNITHIRDDAQQTVFFRNHRVDPSADYIYDAIYRLISATGREHLGQASNASVLAPTPSTETDGPAADFSDPRDGNAMGGYSQTYGYDALGNILQLIHRGTDPLNPGWTRNYAYDAPSLIEPGKTSNRLTATQIGSQASLTYSYDAHGNMTAMPHLPAMQWDFQDRLHATRQQVVNGGTGDTTYYVYDASGQRVRKVSEKNGGALIEERIYLGGFELFRRRTGGGVQLERETLHVMDGVRRIALVETKTIDDGGKVTSPAPLIRYQHDNHLGSACLELDAAGAVISYEEFYPYGSTAYQAVSGDIEVSPKRYRFTGKERDEETGFNYHGARYYAPWLGRWTNCDPSGLKGGANLFAYTEGNPIRLNDPSGMEGEDPKAPKCEFKPFNVDEVKFPKSGSEVTVTHEIENKDDPCNPILEGLPPRPNEMGVPSTVFGNQTQSLGPAGAMGGSYSIYRGVTGPGGGTAPMHFYPHLDVEMNFIAMGIGGRSTSDVQLPAGSFTTQLSARVAPFSSAPNVTLGAFGNFGPTGQKGSALGLQGNEGLTAQFGGSPVQNLSFGGFVQGAVGESSSGRTYSATATPIAQYAWGDNSLSMNATVSLGTGGSFLNQVPYGKYLTGGGLAAVTISNHLLVEAGATYTTATRSSDAPDSSTRETRLMGGIGYTTASKADEGGPSAVSFVTNVFGGLPGGATGSAHDVPAIAVMGTFTFAARLGLY